MSGYYVYRTILNPGPPGMHLAAAVAAMFEGRTTGGAQLGAAEALRGWLGELEIVAAHARRAGWREETGGGIFVFETLAQIAAEEAGTAAAFVFAGGELDAPSYIVSSRDLGRRMADFLLLRPGDQ